MKTIFVSMATIDDTETPIAIKNAFESADFPERISFGVACTAPKKSYYKNLLKETNGLKVKSVYAKISPRHLDEFGNGKGRKRAMSFYNNEDYVLQVDSHTLFEKGWDTQLIDLFEEAKKDLGFDKLILTAYLGRYWYKDYNDRYGYDRVPNYSYFVSTTMYSNVYPAWDDGPLDTIKDTKNKWLPSVKFNGNFSFGDSQYGKNPGIYQNSLFYEEEIIQSINLLDNGFKLVFPNIETLPLSHLYSDDINECGGKRSFMMDHLSDKKALYLEDMAAQRYFKYISDYNNLSKIRKYEKYAKINLKFGTRKDRYVPEGYDF